MKVLLVGLTLVLCVGVVEVLQCKVCRYKIPFIGWFPGGHQTLCSPHRGPSLPTPGKVTLYYQQGCTSAMNCGRERASDAESRLTSRYSCCETDLCNEEWDEEPAD
ncbi:hypothetical protein N320_09207 [Buceros rhinoceros silvestris]|uniref:Uncharacterized protein n=1 Tax=Buceros rhinoceros silvestris TaxID=175836 RepID=A0A091GTX4_BUCRH|nr:hypothetical protein N320_09207 [Buceros rhinoceros silvestris]